MRKEPKKPCWWKALLAEIALGLPGGVVAALSLWLGTGVFGFFSWAVMPLFGFYLAYRATVGGLNNYLSWIFPPLCMWLGHFIVWMGYSPRQGPVLLCALISLIGAAAGEVKKTGKRR